jgi:hypothetical protein
MTETPTERRSRRSDDPLVALHYQLAQAREVTACDVMVLAEPSGLVVAGAGSWPACEELAAYAPFLASECALGALSTRVDALRREVEVLSLEVDGQPMYLCARGGTTTRESMQQTAEGVARILRTAA